LLLKAIFGECFNLFLPDSQNSSDLEALKNHSKSHAESCAILNTVRSKKEVILNAFSGVN
jgi:hypothetical protein